MSAIVVTGATGHVGHSLSERLLARGVPVRVVGRSASKLARVAALGADVRVGSLADPAFLQETFRGARAVFAMIPPDYATPDHRAYQRATADSLASALRGSGVTHVVALSSVGAELEEGTGPIAGLHDLEQRLNAIAGLSTLSLRAAYFMENHLGSIGLIKSAGTNGSAQRSDAPLAMVATRDIAAVAADALAAPNFEGHAVRYVLGPRDYTLAEATRILGTAIGRPELGYVQFPSADMANALVAAGLSRDVARLFVEMQEAFNAGRIRAPRTPECTTPTTLEEFARDTFAPAFG